MNFGLDWHWPSVWFWFKNLFQTELFVCINETHHWLSLLRPWLFQATPFIWDDLKSLWREWTIQRAIGTALCHKLFHSVTIFGVPLEEDLFWLGFRVGLGGPVFLLFGTVFWSTLLAKSNGVFFVFDFWKLSYWRNVFNFGDNMIV